MLDTTKLRAEFEKAHCFEENGEYYVADYTQASVVADFFISKFESHQKSRLEEVEGALLACEVILPLAKGWAHEHPVGNNLQMVVETQEKVTKLRQALLTKNLEK